VRNIANCAHEGDRSHGLSLGGRAELPNFWKRPASDPGRVQRCKTSPKRQNNATLISYTKQSFQEELSFLF
jgi:hypothetical protein